MFEHWSVGHLLGLVAALVCTLLAFGIIGPMGAAALQPLGAAMLSSQEDSAVNLVIAWGSLGLQLVLAVGWVCHLFRSRVLDFARAQRA